MDKRWGRDDMMGGCVDDQARMVRWKGKVRW